MPDVTGAVRMAAEVREVGYGVAAAGVVLVLFMAMVIALQTQQGSLLRRFADKVLTGNGTASGGLHQLHEKIDRIDKRLSDGDKRFTRIEVRLDRLPCTATSCDETKPRPERGRKDQAA